MGALSMITLFMTPLVGWFSDVYGKVICLRISSLSALTGFLLVSTADGPIQYIVGRIIPSFFKCGMVVSQAYISVQSGEGESSSVKTTSALGMLYALVNVAFVVGPIIGGLLAKISLTAPWIAAALSSTLNIILLFVLREPHSMKSALSIEKFDPGSEENTKPLRRAGEPIVQSKQETESDASHGPSARKELGLLSNRDFFVILHLKFAFGVGNAFYENFYGQFMKDKLFADETTIGWCLGFAGLIAVIVNAFALTAVVKHLGTGSSTILLLTLGQGFGLWMWGSSTNVRSLVYFSAIMATTSNIFSHILLSKIAIGTSSEKKGWAMGISSNADRAARVIAQTSGGFAIDLLGYERMGLLAGCTALYCAFYTILFWKDAPLKEKVA
jgi:MFS family permease